MQGTTLNQGELLCVTNDFSEELAWAEAAWHHAHAKAGGSEPGRNVGGAPLAGVTRGGLVDGHVSEVARRRQKTGEFERRGAGGGGGEGGGLKAMNITVGTARP